MSETNFSEAKSLIRRGVLGSIDFKELRAKLPDWRTPLQSLVFDVLAEMGIKTVPFAGMIHHLGLPRKPNQIDESRTLNIFALLPEKRLGVGDARLVRS